MQCNTYILLRQPQKPCQDLQLVEKEGGRGEVHTNLVPPGVTKISFFSIFWTFWAASS
jgi:hypothetical protein